MDIQFAFANPKRVKSKQAKRRAKKHVAKRKKSSKLKAKRPIKLIPLGKSSHKGKKMASKKRRKTKGKKRNPEQVYSTKKSADGKLMKDVSHVFPSKKEVQKLFDKATALGKRELALIQKRASLPDSSLAEKSKLLKQAAKIKAEEKAAVAKADAASKERDAELKTLGVHQSEGWKLKLKKLKSGAKAAKKGVTVAKKKKAKKAKKSKKAKKAATKKVAKKARKAKKSVAKKAKKARKSRKARKSTKKASRRKAKKVAKKAAPKRRSKRRGKGKRKYAKRITHSHSRKVNHVKKGTTMSGVMYSKGKGKKRLKAKMKIKFNPFGGSMKVSVKDLTGYEGYAEPLALLAGGAVYQKVNALLQKYVPAQIQAVTLKIPGVGPALLPILAGVALHMAGKKVPGKAGEMISLLGEGLIGASVVGAGVSLSQSIPMLGLSGINYTPMSGVNYTPNMSGINYTPMSGASQQLGRSPDFGSADYGGGAGYTQAHPFSNADFGADDEDDADYGDEEAGLGSMA